MEKEILSPKFGKQVIYFDPEFNDFVNSHSWTIIRKKNGNIFYSVTRWTIDGIVKVRAMHRIFMNAGSSDMIDHKDGNGLNNQISNLRIVSNDENLMNRGATIRSKTGYKGVFYRKDTGKYQARIQAYNIGYIGGCFDTAEEAAIRYNEMALQYHGEFARLNIIPDTRELLAKNSIEV